MKTPSHHRCLRRTEHPTNVPEPVEISLPELVQQMETLRDLAGDNPSPKQRREMARLYEMFTTLRKRFMRELNVPDWDDER